MDCFELQSSLLLQIEKAEHSALLKVPFTCMIPIISYTCEVPFNKDSTTDMRCAVASNVFFGFSVLIICVANDIDDSYGSNRFR